jgi:hypothetical protein
MTQFISRSLVKTDGENYRNHTASADVLDIYVQRECEWIRQNKNTCPGEVILLFTHDM